MLHKYVYVPFPPVGLAVICPLLFPQVVLTGARESESDEGCVIVVVVIVEHPLLSVTVSVYVFAIKLLSIVDWLLVTDDAPLLHV